MIVPKHLIDLRDVFFDEHQYALSDTIDIVTGKDAACLDTISGLDLDLQTRSIISESVRKELLVMSSFVRNVSEVRSVNSEELKAINDVINSNMNLAGAMMFLESDIEEARSQYLLTTRVDGGSELKEIVGVVNRMRSWIRRVF